ncbi:doublesex- and mab-3-related transcription factor C1-like [Ochotona princeps]|uniref:doublesex- and mab-3-related transcription factor C1-like n=1 Tax=Ochotona princeps TaxID=9978 RepID=UPI0027151866|nr:doublesex- and mab-3-related transcription factor C1-like [Ochotona princeps]
MAIAPGAPIYVKNMSMGTGVQTGKVNIIPQTQVYPCYISNPGIQPGVLLLTQPSEAVFLPYTPVTTEPQLLVSISGQPQVTHILPGTCTNLILQPCATADTLLLQPQVSQASDQTSEQASTTDSEWQQKLEAAEALLALRNSSPAPDYMSLEQPCGQPVPAGNTTHQPQVSTVCPRPVTSNSPHGGSSL